MKYSVSYRIRPLIAALALAFIAPAYALRLGEPTVLSHIGENLKVIIPITESSPDELRKLQASIADSAGYLHNNIAMPTWAQNIVVTVLQAGSAPFITIDGPVQNEAIADLVLELRWPAGRMFQVVPLLLDPIDPSTTTKNSLAVTSQPTLSTTQEIVKDLSTASVITKNSQESSTNQANVQPVVTNERHASNNASKIIAIPEAKNIATEKSALKSQTRPEEFSQKVTVKPRKIHKQREAVDVKKDGTLTVKDGDTLTRLAKPLVTDNVSLEQALAAFTQVNTEAFIDGNINRMHSGVILKIPTKEDLAKNTEVQAKNIVLTHSHNFTNYSKNLANAVTFSQAKNKPATSQSAGGKIETKVSEAIKSEQSQDKLKLSTLTKDVKKPADAVVNGSDKKVAIGTKTQPAIEDAIAIKKANEEKAARLADLARISKMQAELLSIKNAKLAAEQKKLLDDKNKAQPLTQAPGPKVVTITSESKPASKAAANIEKPITKPKSVIKSEKLKIKPAPVEEPSAIVESPLAMGGILGGLLLLLAAPFIARSRKKRKHVQSGDEIKRDEPTIDNLSALSSKMLDEKSVKTTPSFKEGGSAINAASAQDVTPIIAKNDSAPTFSAISDTASTIESSTVDINQTQASAHLVDDFVGLDLPVTTDNKHAATITSDADLSKVSLVDELVLPMVDFSSNAINSSHQNDVSPISSEQLEAASLHATNPFAGDLPKLDFLDNHDTNPLALNSVESTSARPELSFVLDKQSNHTGNEPLAGFEHNHVVNDTDHILPVDAGNEGLRQEVDMADKLALAKLYIDLGDTSGAHELLTEISLKGTDEQVSLANSLLTKIA